jgi:hypothetical protein
VNKRTQLVAVAIAALAAQSAFAHHGFRVHYDLADQVRIEGRVHEVLMRNPHAIIRVQTNDENGEDVVWTCETQSASTLRRKGITADKFVVDQPIIIEGSRARRNPHGCEVGSIHFADGDSLVLRTVEGHAKIDVNNVGSTSALRDQSVLGTWLRDNFSGPPIKPGVLDLITDAGREANSQYVGSRDDPTRQCSPVNPVRAWIAPGAPTEIREQDGYVVIQHEFMDTTRYITMDSDEVPSDIERSDMGYSTGRFDGQTLIVDTTHFAAGVMLTHAGEDSGVLHSEDLEMTEIFSVVPDTGELRIQFSARDAQYFPEPITGELKLSPSNLSIDKFDCQLQED